MIAISQDDYIGTSLVHLASLAPGVEHQLSLKVYTSPQEADFGEGRGAASSIVGSGAGAQVWMSVNLPASVTLFVDELSGSQPLPHPSLTNMLDVLNPILSSDTSLASAWLLPDDLCLTALPACLKGFLCAQSVGHASQRLSAVHPFIHGSWPTG